MEISGSIVEIQWSQSIAFRFQFSGDVVASMVEVERGDRSAVHEGVGYIQSGNCRDNDRGNIPG